MSHGYCRNIFSQEIAVYAINCDSPVAIEVVN